MVYNSKTFVVYHQLTAEGKKNYEKLLEHEADEILFKHQHPVKWFIRWLKGK